MILNILIAVVLMVLTTAIHAGGMMLTIHIARKQTNVGRLRQKLRHSQVYRVSGIVLMMFFVSLVEVLIWAGTYLALNAVQDFEQAVYFSMATFTTLGYGDVVLNEDWRILASFEAANGIIMFGWTTAIVVAVVHRVYLEKVHEHHGQND